MKIEWWREDPEDAFPQQRRVGGRQQREQSSKMRTEAEMHMSETLKEAKTGEGLGGTE